MTSDAETRRMLDANRMNWDARTPVHVASEFYDLAGARAGADRLAAFEWEELGDLNGLDVAHLQCHIGTDTLCLRRAGANTVGLDFSAESVKAAGDLAKESELDVRYVQADVHDAVEALGAGRFDIVYTGKGSLVWLPDPYRWARVVAELLRPGGQLYLAEFHPLLWALQAGGDQDSSAEELRIASDYLGSGESVEDQANVTYTDGPPLEGSTTVYMWNHDLGTVVTAIASSGLSIVSLAERDVLPWTPLPGMRPAGEGWWRLPEGAPRVPLIYSLRALKV